MTPTNAEGRRHELDALAIALIVACALLWGVNQVAAKVALTEIPPLLQAALRSAGATVLLLAWVGWRQLPIWQADGTGRAGLLAGLLFAAEFACIFVGLQYTAASRMVVFLYTAPFVVAVGMPLIARHERLGRLQSAGLVLAFAGVLWAFGEGFGSASYAPMQWLGDALGIAAALLWAATTLVLRATRLSSALPEKALLYQLAVSTLALGAASWLAGEGWPRVITGVSLWPLAFQTVVVTFGSYLTWFWLVRHYPATKVSAFTLLAPIFGLVAGVALLDEPLTIRLAVALITVSLGLWLVSRPQPARR
jgi:drug/metabolite transporter (DMT)-like permease